MIFPPAEVTHSAASVSSSLVSRALMTSLAWFAMSRRYAAFFPRLIAE
jgi:hypothetical protein